MAIDSNITKANACCPLLQQGRVVNEAITREVGSLTGLDLEELRAVWRARYGAPPPLRSVELLRLMLAWRVQAEALGGLDRETRRQLKRRGAVETEGLELGVGARLCREWQGRTVEVACPEEVVHRLS